MADGSSAKNSSSNTDLFGGDQEPEIANPRDGAGKRLTAPAIRSFRLDARAKLKAGAAEVHTIDIEHPSLSSLATPEADLNPRAVNRAVIKHRRAVPIEDRLKPEYRRFAANMGNKLMSPEDAYRDAFATDKINARHLRACLAHPGVMILTDRYRQLHRDKEAVTGPQLRRHVIGRLMHISESGQTEQAQVRALELLGRMPHVNVFGDHAEEISQSTDPDQLRNEIVAKLRRVFGLVIDADTTLASPDPAVPSVGNEAAQDASGPDRPDREEAPGTPLGANGSLADN